MASLESSADTHREHLRLRTLLVGDRSKRSNKVARPFSFWEGSAAALPSLSWETVQDLQAVVYAGKLPLENISIPIPLRKQDAPDFQLTL